MAAIRTITRRGSTNIWDVFYEDGTATTVYSATTPNPAGTLRAPLNLVDVNGAVLQSLDSYGIGNKVNAPLSIYDGAGALLKTLTGIDDIAPVRRVKVALGALDTGGGVVSWQNPESVEINIFGVSGKVTTIATAACQLDIGVQATGATTLSDNLIDGIDVHTAVLPGFNINNQTGVNGLPSQVLAPGKWLTASMASGAAAGLVGALYFFYTLID